MQNRVLVWLSALTPVVLLAAALAYFWQSSGGFRLEEPVGPIEEIAFERLVFQPDEIVAQVRNVGPGPVTIAQVQVGWLNRASWEFSVEPSETIPRLGTARVRIPFPWNSGEPYEVVLFTENGLPFAHSVDMAAPTPQFGWDSVWQFSVLGIYVGVIPVFLGILWLPFLRTLRERGYAFLMSLTVGLLVFLGVDALHDAVEVGAELPGPFQGIALILIGVSMTLLVLYAFARWVEQRRAAAGGESALLIAYLVAFGIGVHNLGEGLAIGGAYALGAIATGALLIVGFMIHNLTEGVAIVAPIMRSRLGKEAGGASWWHLVWLGALAGVPTIFGTSLGAFAPSPVLGVLFLSIGAGAVFQVVVEIYRLMRRPAGGLGMFSGAHVSGFLAGLLVMYLTGLLVTV